MPTTHTKPVAIACSTRGAKITDALPGDLARCPTCGTWSGTVERPRLPRRPMHCSTGRSGMPR